MAAPTLAEFRALFHEFDDAPDPLVQACLDEADNDTPEGVWGKRQFDGVRWLAAVLIARLPDAKEMRIDGTDRTLYRTRREELERIVYAGPTAVGRY